MKIKAFSTLGEISHFAISGYFVISGFGITGVDCINTVEPANNGHTRDWLKWPLCTGDRYIQVGYNMGSLVGTY